MKPLVGFALLACFAITIAQVPAQTGKGKDKDKDKKLDKLLTGQPIKLVLPESVVIKPGDTATLQFYLHRDKPATEATVTIEGLPDGVVADPPELKAPKDIKTAILKFILKAKEDAKDGDSKVAIIKAKADDLEATEKIKVFVAIPKPPPIIGSVELIDGSKLSCEFPLLLDKVLKKFEKPGEKTVEKFVEVQVPPSVSIELDDLGVATLPLSKVRLIDFQGKSQRVVAHTGDIMMGTIVSPGFVVRATTAGGQPFQLKSERISRISFPEPPPF